MCALYSSDVEACKARVCSEPFAPWVLRIDGWPPQAPGTEQKGARFVIARRAAKEFKDGMCAGGAWAWAAVVDKCEQGLILDDPALARFAPAASCSSRCLHSLYPVEAALAMRLFKCSANNRWAKRRKTCCLDG